MPRVTKRVMALKANNILLELALFYECLIQCGLIEDLQLNIVGTNMKAGFFMIILLSLQQSLTSRLRYLPGVREFRVPKSTKWMRAVLPLYDAARRAAFIRVNDHLFNYIIWLLSRYCRRVFKPPRGPDQHSMRLQVAIGLTRIGSYGNSASVARVAALFGTSEGFISASTSRTIAALNAIAPKFIKWPRRPDRAELSAFARENYGFPGAIGSVDGTTIPLYKAPAIVPWSFFDRKSRYSLHALVTVNHNYEVIDLVVNYLGPAPDSVVQRDAVWQKYPGEVFTRKEYLLGDKGMLYTLQVVIPYKGKDASVADNANYNTQHARLRIIAEQVIGQVKTSFSSLKELCVQIETMEDVKRGGEWIIAAFVLHNLCVKAKDYVRPDSINSFRSTQPVPDSMQPSSGSQLEDFRAGIKSNVINFMKENGHYVP